MQHTALRVLDVGAGEGRLWGRLKTEFVVSEYLPVDRKPRLPGTLKADVTPAWLFGQNLAKYNVIDLDLADDSVWELYLTVAMILQTPCVVFLTSKVKTSAGLSNQLRLAAGLPMHWKPLPVNAALIQFAANHALMRGATQLRATEPVLSFGPVDGISGYAIKAESASAAQQ